MSSNPYQNEMAVRDRLMRAWENSMELTRDFQMYSTQTPQGEISDTFREFAEDEAHHAAKLKSLIEQEKWKKSTKN
ncbi:MAG: hypothetical protein BWY15_01022 [Firmicutes bacterium ADurb.Bin193]|nr:MAG: hypothetical protein BWY15_01022 [Firmicutes bacterium ADurb.Bin193]